MKSLILTTGLVAACFAQPLLADPAGTPSSPWQAGINLGQHVFDSPFSNDNRSATGFGLFVGYELENAINDVRSTVEVGYTQTDDFYRDSDTDITSFWVAGVLQKRLPELNPNFFVVGRFGLDLGDDDGLLMGFGVAMQHQANIATRAEFINKDTTKVYQLSLLFSF